MVHYMGIPCGGVAEWLKAHAWKACVCSNVYREFESHLLRQNDDCISVMLAYNHKYMRSLSFRSAFTLVEVMVVIVVIAILATLVTLGLTTIQADARDSQRSVATTTLSDALESYYDKNGEYPSCAMMTGSLSSVQTLLGVSDEVLSLPQSTSDNAIVCTDITDGSSGDVIAYVGNSSTQCSTGTACVTYTLKYYEESTGEVKELASRRSAVVVDAPTAAASVTTASISGSTANASATAVSCSGNSTPQYRVDLQVNDGSWQSGEWGTSRARSTSAAEGSQYGFRTLTRCVLLDGSAGSSTAGAVDEAVRAINAPSAPVVSRTGGSSGTSDSTVWTWTTPSCGGGTVRYSRAWSRDDATGWRAWSSDVTSTSYTVTTNYEGYQYAVKVRAKCVTSYTESGYSSDSNAPTYLHNVVAPGLATSFTVTTINKVIGGVTYDRFIDYTSPTCGTGTTIQRRQVYAFWRTDNESGGWVNFFAGLTNEQARARYKNPSTIMDSETNWNGTGVFATYDTEKGMNVSTNPNRGRLPVQHRCINTTTGRYAEGGTADSGILVIR